MPSGVTGSPRKFNTVASAAGPHWWSSCGWNGTSASMRKAKGAFSLGVELPTGASYQYRFVTDAGEWLNDTEADCYVYSPFADADNSVVVL